MKEYPLFKVKINTDDAFKNIREVLESGYLNEGVQVTKLKEKLSEIFDHKNVTPTNSCTSAIMMALKLSGVEKDDEVITTSMTCVATNTPIVFMGAKVVWCDINHKTGNIDPDKIESLITPRTKAVICVHWAGNPCDIESLAKICKKYDIKLIQDAAHAFGTKVRNKHVCHFGDYTCYSFQAIKHVTSGDGGALICNSNSDHKRASSMKWFGIDRDTAKDDKGEWKGQRWEIDIVEAGNKFHMNNIAAALGLSSLVTCDEVIAVHVRNADLYDKYLSSSNLVMPLSMLPNSLSTSWVYTVILSDNLDRDKVLKQLNESGIQAGLVHVPNHHYSCFRQSLTKLPETEKFHKQQISLPCGWWLEETDIEHISKRLLELVK